MPSPRDYREVRLERGQLVNQIKGHGQRDWMKACEKLGLCVVPASGRGSHCAVYKNNVCPPEDSSCCVVTIPTNLYPNFQRDLVKKVLLYGLQSGRYDEDDLWRALGVIK